MKGVIILIVGFILLYALAFCIMMTPIVFVNEKGPRVDARKKVKKVFSLDGVTPSIIVSRLIWAFIGVIMIIYALSLILPLFWMFYTSLKDRLSYINSTFALPKWSELAPENYVIALKNLRIEEGMMSYGLSAMFFNSIVTSVWSPLKGVLWMAMTAYVISRIKFPGGKFLYNYGIVLMIVPIYGTGATGMLLQRALGLYDNLYVSLLVTIPATPWSGMNFLILYAALKAIPGTYTEAAELDGAGPWRIMLTIILPMVLPTMATFYLLGFIAEWNNYESFLVYFPSYPNISYGIYRFQKISSNGAEGLSTPQILAGMVFVMTLPMILYLAFQKVIRSKLTVGGLKG